MAMARPRRRESTSIMLALLSLLASTTTLPSPTSAFVLRAGVAEITAAMSPRLRLSAFARGTAVVPREKDWQTGAEPGHRRSIAWGRKVCEAVYPRWGWQRGGQCGVCFLYCGVTAVGLCCGRLTHYYVLLYCCSSHLLACGPCHTVPVFMVHHIRGFRSSGCDGVLLSVAGCGSRCLGCLHQLYHAVAVESLRRNLKSRVIFAMKPRLLSKYGVPGTAVVECWWDAMSCCVVYSIPCFYLVSRWRAGGGCRCSSSTSGGREGILRGTFSWTRGEEMPRRSPPSLQQ